MGISKSARRRRRRELKASDDAPSELSFSGEVTFTPESLEAGEDERIPSFDLVAYNGDVMTPSGVNKPTVIDLSGVQAQNPTPAFLDHQTAGRAVVGHAEVKVGKAIEAAGIISGHTEAAHTVVQSAKRGFPWKASVGGRIVRSKMVARGEHVTVNGRRQAGPFLLIKAFDLREISFVPIAADNTTSAAIAATGGFTMDEKFKEWLEAADFVPDKLDAPQLRILEAAWKATLDDGKPSADPPPVAALDPTADDLRDANDKIAAQVGSMREAAALELKRQNEIREKVPSSSMIQATAIAEGWSPERAELEWLRKQRSGGPSVHMRDMSAKPETIEAALCMNAGMDAKWLGEHGGYDDKAIEAASGQEYSNYGFSALCMDYLTANGRSIKPGISTDSLINMTKETYRDIKASMGYSTISLPGIMSNVLNKRLLQSFQGIDPVAQRISANRPVRDFKKTYAFRLTGNGEFLEIGITGEIKTMGLQEEQFENQAKTYGRMISISRNMLINDDLGALAAIPAVLGRKAGMKLQKEWFTLFLTLEGTAFFSTANANLSGTSRLGLDGLTKAEQLFLDQTDEDGDPIGVMPRTLLVPTALKVTAEELMNSTTTMMTDVGTTGPTEPMSQLTKTTVTNPHVGKWSIESTPWLYAQNLEGRVAADETSWYLFADPADLAAMEIVYLNGRQTPFIQSEDADFSTLGFHYRSYFDFGVKEQDHRAVVKATVA